MKHDNQSEYWGHGSILQALPRGVLTIADALKRGMESAACYVVRWSPNVAHTKVLGHGIGA